MSQRDYELFMRLLDEIKPPPPPRFYAESDGDPWAMTHYVCHTHGGRIDCGSRHESRELSKSLNRLIGQPHSA